jgi:hypothetical protein
MGDNNEILDTKDPVEISGIFGDRVAGKVLVIG